MKTGIFILVLCALGLPAVAVSAAAATAPAPAPAPNGAHVRATTLTLADFGYANDVTLAGVYPTFTFNVPVTRALTGAQLTLHVHVSPLADSHSSIKVLVNGVPVFARYVHEIGHNAILSIPLPIPAKPAVNMQVVVKGYLFVTGDICFDLQTTDLYMTIDSASSVTVTTTALPGHADIADFFQGYGSRIDIVDRRVRSVDDPDLQLIAIPYAIRQLELWHQPAIVLAKRPDPRARNIVIQPGDTYFDALAQTLFVNPRDLGLVTSRMASLLVVNRIVGGSSTVTEAAPSPAKRVSLQELGIVSQTASGLGEISFELPLQANRLGGLPSDLVFHLAYAQTPLLPGTTGMIRAELNGSLIASRTLSQDGRNALWDIGIPSSTLSAVNDLRIIAAYYTGPGSCKGNLPQLTMTVGDTSYFSWGSVEHHADGIADYLKIVSGNVGIFVGDAAMIPQAFHLVSELGRLNGAITHLTVAKFTGTIPSGYDYTFVFAPPQALKNVDAPLDLAESKFRIVNPLTGQTLFEAIFGEPLGALELATIDHTPALVLSYWSSPAPLAHFLQYDIATLTQQVGNISLFDDTIETYEVGQKLRIFYASGDLAVRIWAQARLPLAILLGFLVVAFVVYAARRLTGGRPT